MLLNLSYFLVPRVPKNSKADLGLYTPLRPKSDTFMQFSLHIWFFTLRKQFFVYPSLVLSPFCLSVYPSFSLPAVC